MADSVTVTSIPWCDFCKQSETLTLAYADGKTTYGPWANMCIDHHTRFGMGLGTGVGQRYILASDTVQESERVLFEDMRITEEPVSPEHEVAINFANRMIDKLNYRNGQIPFNEHEVEHWKNRVEQAVVNAGLVAVRTRPKVKP